MRYWKLLFVILMLNQYGYSQSYFGTGGRSVALSGAVGAMYDKCSGLAQFDNCYSLEISYHNRYFIPELGSSSINFWLPVKKGGFSPRLDYFGTQEYNVKLLTLACLHKLTPWIYSYFQMGSLNKRISRLDENAYYLYYKLGCYTQFHKNIFIGLLLANPFPTDAESLVLSGYSAMELGIVYQIEHSFGLGLQWEYEDFKHSGFSLGTEFFMLKYFILRAGLRLPDFNSFSFGMEFLYKKSSIATGIEQHPVLGISTAVTWKFYIPKNEKPEM